MATSMIRPLFSTIRKSLVELRRRHVFRVAVAYIAIGLAVIEAANSIVPNLDLSPLLVRAIVVVVILGFPVALVLAWALDLTPHGLVRTPDDEAPASEPKPEPEPKFSADLPLSRLPGAHPSAAPSVPPPHTPFVGRSAELNELRRLLSTPACRLVTILGAGGMGKTRLAAEFARSGELGFADDVAFVPLGGTESPESLAPILANWLGMAPPRRQDTVEPLLDYLRDQRLLLIIDNFEHVLPGAELLTRLLDATPSLKILVTSRERLGIQLETLFHLEGLDVPVSPEEIDSPEAFAAVELYLQSARRIDASFSPAPDEWEIIAKICHLLSGVPLAIELASAWTRALSCEQILVEIQRDLNILVNIYRDVPDRHRSLRAAFDASWRLLSREEQDALRRLSVFRGSFGRDAAQMVASVQLPILSSLLDKSLLRRIGPDRFQILEVLRQYVAGKLAENLAEERWMRRLHADYYSHLLHDAQRPLVEEQSAIALERLSLEVENVRQAWPQIIQENDLSAIERSFSALFALYDMHGWVQEGERLFAQAVDALSGQGSHVQQQISAQLTLRQGIFRYHQGDYPAARALLERGLAMLPPGTAPDDRADAVRRLGQVHHFAGEYPEARELAEQSLAIARQIGDRRGEARSLIDLGNIWQSIGSTEDARRRYRESLDVLREVHDETARAFALMNLAIMAARDGNHGEAEGLLHESLTLGQMLHNERLIGHCLQNLGCVASEAGDLDRAEQYLVQGERIGRERGLRRVHGACAHVLASVLAAKGRIAESRDLYNEAISLAVQNREVPRLLDILLELITNPRHWDGDEFTASAVLFLILQHPGSHQDLRVRAEEKLHDLASCLDAATMDAARDRGAKMSLEDAVSYATQPKRVNAGSVAQA